MKRKILFLALFIAMTASVFAQDLSLALVPYRQGELWGYSDPARKVIIKPAYHEANLFHEGFACVRKGKMYGYINMNGKVVVPIKYSSAKPFQQGYINPGDKQKTTTFAKVKLEAAGMEICIDTTGAKMAKCPVSIEKKVVVESDPLTAMPEINYASVPKSNLYDRVVGGYRMMGTEDIYYIGVKDKNYGVVKNKTDVVIPFQYSGIKKINGNVKGIVYLLVEKEGKKGVIFGNGSPYIPIENSELVTVAANNGKDYFIITKDGKTGVKNTGYQEIVPFDYSNIAYDSTGGFVLMSDTLKGFYFFNNLRVEPKYKEVKLVTGGEYLIVRTKLNKTGFVNRKGEEYFEDYDK